MTNLTKSTIVLAQPIQGRFAKRHERGAIGDNGGTGPLCTVCEIDVGEVEDTLNDVHEGLSIGKPVVVFQGWNTVKIVDLLVKCIWTPPYPMKITAFHRPRSHKAISSVPDEYRSCYEEPSGDPPISLDRHGFWRVDVQVEGKL